MKKYIVIKQYMSGFTCSTVVFTSDSKDDVVTYADLMNRNKEADDNYSYKAAELC